MTVTRFFSSISCILLLVCTLPGLLPAQTKEVVQELSKAAKKGVLTDVKLGDDGNIRLTYKMKVDKKSDEVLYEDYVFGKDLSYKGMQPSSVNKEMKPNQKAASVVAYVGGTNSFNVLSMNLTLRRAEYEKIWNNDRQQYEWGKQLSSEVVKPRNNETKYKGFDAWDNTDDGSVLVLAGYEKSKTNDFLLLHVSLDLDLKETKIPLDGNYSLVYTGALESGNVFAVFAPEKGMAQLNRYMYVEATRKGEVVLTKEFTAPANATVIMDYEEVDGNLYFAALSDLSQKAFNESFTDYAPILNPGYTTSANMQMFKYEKSVFGKSFEQFHLLRFQKGALTFTSTSSVKDFKSKLVTPPSQKKAAAYNGQSIDIQKIYVTPGGEYLVSGQLKDRKITANSYDYLFGDYVCFHFDAAGNLKAQYAVDKLIDGSKDQLFRCDQQFIPASDGQGVYWEIMEVKSTKYYSSFSAAYNGVPSYSGHYLPRILKMDLANKQLSDVTTLGEKGKYLVYNLYPKVFQKQEKPLTVFYVGHDEDYEKIWLGKYIFE